MKVTARDHLVVLSGNVRSWSEREEAERAGVVVGLRCGEGGKPACCSNRGNWSRGSTEVERSFYGREHEGVSLRMTARLALRRRWTI